MSNLTIPDAFAENIKQETQSVIENALELGLDEFLEDGLIKDIPFVSSVISVYKIGTTIKEIYHLKKS